MVERMSGFQVRSWADPQVSVEGVRWRGAWEILDGDPAAPGVRVLAYGAGQTWFSSEPPAVEDAKRHAAAVAARIAPKQDEDDD